MHKCHIMCGKAICYPHEILEEQSIFRNKGEKDEQRKVPVMLPCRHGTTGFTEVSCRIHGGQPPDSRRSTGSCTSHVLVKRQYFKDGQQMDMMDGRKMLKFCVHGAYIILGLYCEYRPMPQGPRSKQSDSN